MQINPRFRRQQRVFTVKIHRNSKTETKSARNARKRAKKLKKIRKYGKNVKRAFPVIRTHSAGVQQIKGNDQIPSRRKTASRNQPYPKTTILRRTATKNRQINSIQGKKISQKVLKIYKIYIIIRKIVKTN